jgi:hypothetical protein
MMLGAKLLSTFKVCAVALAASRRANMNMNRARKYQAREDATGLRGCLLSIIITFGWVVVVGFQNVLRGVCLLW